jgi:hypothetical protein
MKYTVKNEHGQLTYGSLEEVKTAFVLGLVEPEDEVIEEGGTLWRKASSIPLLVTAAKVRADRTVFDARRAWALGGVALAIIDFYLLWNGYQLAGFAVALGVAAALIQVTVISARRKR